ncbi:response regulator transcription factor [Litoribacillus peritrichatus]|uniref:Response regulator transcription factor n=1 Tax=Litoribacillus peritrichatus TaxID=718191 RepID=A0ABP7M0U0_9GAMM
MTFNSDQGRAVSKAGDSQADLLPINLNCHKALNVLLIDDHQIYLDGLGITLSLMDSIEQVYQATCLIEAEAVVHEVSLDLILLDLTLPVEDGFSIMSQLETLCPNVPVIILSGSDLPEDKRLAMNRGAKGFLNKSATGDEIREAIKKVSEGGVLSAPVALAASNEDDLNLMNQIRVSVARQYRITQRQAEVLVLLGEGLSNKQICRRLELTEATVKFHLKAIFLALDVHNRTECVSVARRLNILI